MGKCAPAADVTRVWDAGVRLFHWLMVAAVAIVLVTGLSGPRNRLNIHIAAGAAIGGLVAFRILWGLMGSTYARFSSFPVQLTAISADLTGLVAGRRPRYLGHNPLGSLMALTLLAILSLSVLTGVITLGGVDKQGPLASVASYGAGKAAQRVHLALAYGLLALIAGHLLGVAYEFIMARTNFLLAMITGEKAASITEHVVGPARAKPILAGLCVLLLMIGAVGQIVGLSARPALGVPTGPLDPTYAQECGSCHMAYPPSLAPSRRWIAIMDGLSDHFGEDASLEPARVSRIRAYLTTNAAEKWDTRAAHELQGSNPQERLRLTATPFWIRMHRSIPESVFKSRAVGANGACGKCHSDASTGRLIPKTSTSRSELLNEGDRSLPDSIIVLAARLRPPAPANRQNRSSTSMQARRRPPIPASADFPLSEASISSGPSSQPASPTRHPARPVIRQTRERPGKPARARTLSRWRPRRVQSVTPIGRKRKNGFDETATTCSAETVRRRKKATSLRSC